MRESVSNLESWSSLMFSNQWDKGWVGYFAKKNGPNLSLCIYQVGIQQVEIAAKHFSTQWGRNGKFKCMPTLKVMYLFCYSSYLPYIILLLYVALLHKSPIKQGLRWKCEHLRYGYPWPKTFWISLSVYSTPYLPVVAVMQLWAATVKHLKKAKMSWKDSVRFHPNHQSELCVL